MMTVVKETSIEYPKINEFEVKYINNSINRYIFPRKYLQKKEILHIDKDKLTYQELSEVNKSLINCAVYMLSIEKLGIIAGVHSEFMEENHKPKEKKKLEKKIVEANRFVKYSLEKNRGLISIDDVIESASIIDEYEGRIRDDYENVWIGGRLPPNKDLRTALNHIISFINSNYFLEKSNGRYHEKTIVKSLERALSFHIHVVLLHPFLDGNGRVSRLWQNILLENAGLPPIIIYPELKDEYISILEEIRNRHTDAIRTYYDMKREISLRDMDFYFKPFPEISRLYNFLAEKVVYGITIFKESLKGNKAKVVDLKRSYKQYLQRNNGKY